MNFRLSRLAIAVLVTPLLARIAASQEQTPEAQAQQQLPAPFGQRPNIVVLWGDDIGLTNVIRSA